MKLETKARMWAYAIAVPLGLLIAKVLLLAQVHLAVVFLLWTPVHAFFGQFPFNAYRVYPEILYIWYASFVVFALVVADGGREVDAISSGHYFRNCWKNSSLGIRLLALAVPLALPFLLIAPLRQTLEWMPVIRLGGKLAFRQVDETQSRRTLVEVDFHDVAFYDEHLQSLRQVFDLGEEFTLDVSGTLITDRALANLVENTNLHALKLADTEITDRGARYLAQCKNLRVLDLNGTGVSDESADMLVHLTKLEELSLARTSLGEIGLARLAELPQLKKLTLWKPSLDESFLLELRSRMPKTEVIAATSHFSGNRIRRPPIPPERKLWHIPLALVVVGLILYPFVFAYLDRRKSFEKAKCDARR